MKTINKEELARQIAVRCDTTAKNALRFIDALEDVVIRAIAMEDRVRFNFGYIGGKTQKPRRIVLPSGEIIHVPEKHGQPYYKPSKLAKDY